MPTPPLVSVIVPCFNHGKYLAESLASIHAQTFKDLEIIVVDDGSTDAESLAALNAAAPLATAVIRTSNQGVIAARNTGIAAARGRYVLTLDADDKIGPAYLALAVAKLEQDARLGIVYCHAEFFGEQQGPWQLPPYRFPDILIGNVIFNAAVFKRSDWQAVGGFNPNMSDGWEDYDFWIALIERGCEVHQLPETLFFYRINANSRNNGMATNSARYAKAYSQIFRNHTALYVKHIDVVFAEMVRLWDVINEKTQQANANAAACADLQQQYHQLLGQQQTLQAQLLHLQAQTQASAGLLNRLKRLLGQQGR